MMYDSTLFDNCFAGRCGGSEDRLEKLISYLKAEVDGEK